ncbi:uncharacterized protein LOC112684284 [Sipha flava]|uniref:Uncharacterized protein LOC112684284 n=1 Tax=Sipha flava TaxID=143950 RepID=A0A8B8FKQ3_9HEMI|nr:uncharacterized protein LOC112684284 [Sipha flava]
MKVIPITIVILLLVCSIQITNSLIPKGVKTLVRGQKLALPFRTSDVNKLVQYTMYEADMIKLAAYNQLKRIYQEKIQADKLKMFVPMMQAAIEVIKSHGANNSLLGIRSTYSEGKKYAEHCLKTITDLSTKATCYKWKALFIEASFFSNNIKANVIVKDSFARAYKEAMITLKNDPKLMYARTKVSCKIKLAVQGKNILSKSLVNLFLGSTSDHQEVNCVTELLKYEGSINKYESHGEEFYYLLGQALEKSGDKGKALEYFKKGRKFPIIDQKVLNILELLTLIFKLY